MDIDVELITLRVTFNQQGEEIIAMNEQMDNVNAIKELIIDNKIVISSPEYDVIRMDLQDMETLISYLEDQNADQFIIVKLREEVSTHTTNLQANHLI